MRILIACEESGEVQQAFARLGHFAMSCDTLPTRGSSCHYQGDVRDLLCDHWDMMIAFPPCTYLCRAGLHWNKRIPGRAELTEQALDFVRLLMNARIPRIAIENPPGCIGTRIRKADQYIQPHWFGHPEAKKTGLWLQGLPKLVATNRLDLPECGYWQNQTPSRQNKLGPSEHRARDRSKTYTGIAEAMANQWGNI